MNQIQILKMTNCDLNEIITNLYENFGSTWNYEIFESELSNTNSSYIVCKKNNEIIGFAGITKLYDEAHIMNISTHIKHRKLGIGTLLLQELIKIATSENLKLLTLEVRKSNVAAQNLYKKFNFEIVGIRKNYYHLKESNQTEDAIIMSLNIN